ncbi:hypothetical protein DMENIID0001_054740 [Sergentomyia squamirostris]
MSSSHESDEPSFVRSQKGSQMLSYKSYTYYKIRESLTTCFWRCSLYKSHKCPGKVSTDKSTRSGLIVKITTDHNDHFSHLLKIEARKIRNKIKDDAVNLGANGRPVLVKQIVDSALEGVDEIVAGVLPTHDALTRQAKRAAKRAAKTSN